MNEDALNLSIRKFLKEVGITSQREIEKAVREGAAQLGNTASVQAQMELTIDVLGLKHIVVGRIDLQ